MREELVNIITKQIRRHFHAPIQIAVSKLGNQAGLIGASVIGASNSVAARCSGSPFQDGTTNPSHRICSESVSNPSSFGEAPA